MGAALGEKMTQLADDGIGSTALRKVAWRLIPFLGVLYFFAFLDRVNVGFAALTMNADLGLSAQCSASARASSSSAM